MKSKLKVGDLIYLKNVGFPYNGEGTDGYESMEGASGIVIALNSGYSKDLVDIEFVFPFKSNRRRESMKTCLFYPTSVYKENRPWLKRNLKKIIDTKNELRKMQEKITDILQTM